MHLVHAYPDASEILGDMVLELLVLCVYDAALSGVVF